MTLKKHIKTYYDTIIRFIFPIVFPIMTLGTIIYLLFFLL
jgi:hypothetical protein